MKKTRRWLNQIDGCHSSFPSRRSALGRIDIFAVPRKRILAQEVDSSKGGVMTGKAKRTQCTLEFKLEGVRLAKMAQSTAAVAMAAKLDIAGEKY